MSRRWANIFLILPPPSQIQSQPLFSAQGPTDPVMVCLFCSSVWIFLAPSSHLLVQTSCIRNVLQQGQPYHGCVKSHLLLSILNLVSTSFI